jgi:hypothetical protein
MGPYLLSLQALSLHLRDKQVLARYWHFLSNSQPPSIRLRVSTGHAMIQQFLTFI